MFQRLKVCWKSIYNTKKVRTPFRFKQFSLDDGNSAMKLSTDAVLLGAFASVNDVHTCLDIGTGSGIIALMIAQKSECKITGIDIDDGSIGDAKLNFENSPWSDRLTAIQTALAAHSQETNTQYDLIVCNPPYFINSEPSPYSRKNISKHNHLLELPEMIRHTSQLLDTNGRCAYILPYSERNHILDLATKEGLFLYREMIVYPKKSKAANRILIELKRINEPMETTSLTIRNEDGSYTSEYKRFTEEFYLQF